MGKIEELKNYWVKEIKENSLPDLSKKLIKEDKYSKFDKWLLT